MSNPTTSIYNISIPGSNIKNLWAKMENKNPTGTHKDRSLGPWISHYARRGVKELVISSSGNSAISAARYCKEKDLKLHVFVSSDIEGYKLSLLKNNKSVVLHLSKTSKKDAIRFAKEHNIVNLRASTDDNALIGYQEIALELIEQLPRIDNIFIPTSSGATLEGIYLGFKAKGGPGPPLPSTVWYPALHVVQTTKVHPIADYFDKGFTEEGESHATAIVDNIAHRRNRVIKIIEETGGGGFVISNKELEEARKILQSSKPTGSPNRSLRHGTGRADPVGFGWQSQAPSGAWQSALAFAGFLKWQARHTKEAEKKMSVCLFTD